MLRPLALWIKIAIAATVLTLAAGGAIGTGVYFGLKGSYFDLGCSRESRFK